MERTISLVIADVRHVVVLSITHVATLAALLVLYRTQVREGNFFCTSCCCCPLGLLRFEDWGNLLRRLRLVILTHASELVYKTLDHIAIPKAK